MKSLLGNYIIIKKSTVVIMAVIAVIGMFAWKHYLRQKGVDPAEDMEQAVEKGKHKAKEMVDEAKDK